MAGGEAVMQLVVTADDFGYCQNRNRGIVEAHTKGIVTAASLLVNGVQAEEAAALAQEHGIPVGLHLNLTEGAPIAPSAKVQSLLGPSGLFLGKKGYFEAAERGDISSDEVGVELAAQLGRFRELMRGQGPAHLDGHNHCHLAPSAFQQVLPMCVAAGVALRIPKDTITGPERFNDFHRGVLDLCAEAAQLADAAGLAYPTGFFGLPCQPLSPDAIFAFASAAKAQGHAVCELMVHPGYRCDVSRPGGCGAGPDAFSQLGEREAELQAVCDPGLQRRLAAAGVQLHYRRQGVAR